MGLGRARSPNTPRNDERSPNAPEEFIKAPQAWYNLTAHPSVPEGEATAHYKISITDYPEGGPGGKRYKLGIPWTRLAPFQPASGANLGMGLILNEDDGDGRVGYSSWFSGPHTKNLDDVGDLILE